MRLTAWVFIYLIGIDCVRNLWETPSSRLFASTYLMSPSSSIYFFYFVSTSQQCYVIYTVDSFVEKRVWSIQFGIRVLNHEII